MKTQLFLVVFLRPQTMATELDVSKSRRFDIAMSRRTRRSTSLASCFQDQYVSSLAQHHHQELKAFLQCQDEEMKALQQCEDAEKTLCLHEDEELKIPQAPLQYEDDEQKTPKQYEDEQEKESDQYSKEEQNISEPYQDDEKKLGQHLHEEKTPEQYQDEDELPSQCQDEELVTPNQPEEDEETTPERFQDVEQKKPQQHQEADAQVSERSAEEDEQEQQEHHGMEEQKAPEQFQAVKKLATPPRVVDNVPRFSLQELIKQKQLSTDEAKPTNNLGSDGESVLADCGLPGPGAAVGGTTLAMVIKRPEGGKKPMGMIRRCVKALNQMIKAKHGSKKNMHF